MFEQVAFRVHHFLFLSHRSHLQLTPTSCYVCALSYYDTARWTHLRVVWTCRAVCAGCSYFLFCMCLYCIFWVGAQSEALPPSKASWGKGSTKTALPPPMLLLHLSPQSYQPDLECFDNKEGVFNLVAPPVALTCCELIFYSLTVTTPTTVTRLFFFCSK